MSAARKRILPGYQKYLNTKSTVAKGLCIAFTALILCVLAFITVYLLIKGVTHISLAFFTELPLPHGVEGAPGGLANALVGTLTLILMASVVGIPLGVLAGIYLSEYSANSWLGAPTRFIADVLTGVPSIVVGILGYQLLVVPLAGANAYAGAAALAFIMIPLVARTTEEMLRLVPHSYREASIALGATKARTILKVVIPAATGSLVTGIMLAIARIAGETAPLLFTAGISRFMVMFTDRPVRDLQSPFPSLPVYIYQYSTEQYHDQWDVAWAGMLILLAMVFLLNLGVRLTVHSMQRNKLARA